MEAIKSLVNFIMRLVVISIALILFFSAAPLLYVAVPFWYLFHPSPYWTSRDMATVVMLTGPFACGFWMTIICHWSTVSKAYDQGRLKTWRDSEGGVSRTVGKSIGFMFLGWIGAAVMETIFSILARPLLHTPAGRMEFFALAPFAVFAPVLIVWLRRWLRSRKSVDFGAASLHATDVQAHAAATGGKLMDFVHVFVLKVLSLDKNGEVQSRNIATTFDLFEAEDHRNKSVENDYDTFVVPCDWQEAAAMSALVEQMRLIRDLIAEQHAEALR